MKRTGSKKTSSCFLRLAVILVLLTGCGGTGSAAEGKAPSPQPASELSQTQEGTNAEPGPRERETAGSEPAVEGAAESNLPGDSGLEVDYIDVGQADAALLLCDGEAMLIDGGNAEDSSLIYTYLKNRSLDHLNYIVCTHEHEDHVGGLAGALNYAAADTALCPVTDYDSRAFQSFVTYLGKQGRSITVPKAGDSFSLGSAEVRVLGPVRLEDEEPNNHSIVLRVVYGKTSFLFTGDAEGEEERDILDAGYDLESTVLKVGHHGGAASTTEPFLKAVAPKYAVISVGASNSYGHPTKEVLERLEDADVLVYRTDLQGDIVCTSDGETVSFSVEKDREPAPAGPGAPEGNGGTERTGTSEENGGNREIGISEGEEGNREISISEGNGGNVSSSTGAAVEHDYVLNTSSRKFHYPDCSGVKKMKDENKSFYTGTRDEVIAMGYSPCGQCRP